MADARATGSSTRTRSSRSTSCAGADASNLNARQADSKSIVRVSAVLVIRRCRRRARPLGVFFALLSRPGGAGSGCRSALRRPAGRERNARGGPTRRAVTPQRSAAGQLGNHVALLTATAQQLAANPQIARCLHERGGCTLSFQGIGGPDRGHLDMMRADGTVACSSSPSAVRGARRATRKYGWFRRALAKPLFLAPGADAVTGAQVAIAAPLPGRKGTVAAFADLAAAGTHLADLYGGGRPTLFLLTTADERRAARLAQPEKWIGKRVPASGTPAARNGATSRHNEALSHARVCPEPAGRSTSVRSKSAVLAASRACAPASSRRSACGPPALPAGSAFVYRQVAAPIRRFSAAVPRRRRAERRTAVPVPVGPAEVRALAEDVNLLLTSCRPSAERRRAESAAQASEESYRLLFESNPSPMYVVRPRDPPLRRRQRPRRSRRTGTRARSSSACRSATSLAGGESSSGCTAPSADPAAATAA